MTVKDSYRTIDGRADSGLIILCDHAENTLPEGYGTLGLPQGQLERHIGYDIGARVVTETLAELFGAPAVLSTYSRLLIDPNRGEDDPTLIMRLSDGAIVPGNRHVDDAERDNRLRRYYWPYHGAIDRMIIEALDAGRPPVLVSIHSFTESWRGRHRPWHVGCLWDRDGRAPRRFLDALEGRDDMMVGDNEPYDGALKNDCMYKHGTALGIAHLLIELRQDLIGDDDGARDWAERMVPAIAAANDDPDCHEIRFHGSRTGPVFERHLEFA